MKLHLKKWGLGAGLMILGAAGLLLAGCATQATPASDKSAVAASSPKAAPAHSGAQLWAQNCGHCHNIRSPDSLSDAQWDIVLLHMRIRANLTAEEHKQILAFLKSAH